MSQGSFPAPRIYGFASATDHSALQYRFMKPSTESAVAKCGAGERPIGVQMNVPSSNTGSQLEVAMPGGGAKLKLAGTVALGQLIKSDADGKGVVVAGAGEEYGARALKAGVSGDVIPVDVITGTSHATE